MLATSDEARGGRGLTPLCLQGYQWDLHTTSKKICYPHPPGWIITYIIVHPIYWTYIVASGGTQWLFSAGQNAQVEH